MSMKYSMALIASLCASLVVAADVLAQGGSPEIIVGRNGEAEVIFGNNCVVYYDDRGRRRDSLPACRGRQIQRADQAIAAYRREQGLDGGSTDHSPGYSSRPPEIIAGRNGEAEVIFDNNCVVYYDSWGGRTKNLPACHRRQLQQADDAIAAYRREQGLDGGTTDHSPGYSGRPPEIIAGRNREAEVIFDNNCVVYYDDRGRRRNSLPACRGNQIQHADQAIAAYRREQGWR